VDADTLVMAVKGEKRAGRGRGKTREREREREGE
jgi:hypothetical protein